jgi:methyl-accepting chemotaxis protein
MTALGSYDAQPSAEYSSVAGVGALQSQAKELSGCLAALHTPLEEAFVVVGGRLGQAFETARNVTLLAEVLASRLSEPQFQETLSGLDRGAKAVTDLQSQKTGRWEALTSVMGSAREISEALSKVERMMAHLGIIGLNGKIQAANLDNTKADFTVFTDATIRLASRGRQVVADSMAAVTDLQRQTEKAIQLQSEFEGTHMAELAKVGGRLSGSISSMRAKQSDSMRLLSTLPDNLRAVHSKIGSVVSDMQFGDITRQRLEHSEEALKLLSSVLSQDRTVFDEEIAEADLPLLTEAICTLHATQLDQASDQFLTRKRDIDTSLRWIAETLQQVRASAEGIHSAQDGSSFLMEIDHDLEKVAEVVTHFNDSVNATEEAMRKVVGAASAAVAALKSLGELVIDLNIIGLNASIRCGNVGMKGKALDVIAQELRGYARQARGSSDSIVARLADVIRQAESLSVDRSGFIDELAELRTWLEEAVERLRQAGGETGWVLNHIQESADGLASSIDEALGHFNGLGAFNGDLQKTAHRLRAMADAARPPMSETQLQDERRRVLGFLAAHYTMSSERDIHRLITGEADHAAEPAAAAAPAADDLSDILF